MSTLNATDFSELQTAVLETFKRTDKTTELKRALNSAYFEMVACIDPRKQKDQLYKSTVIGREEYPIPETVLRINHPIRIIEGTTNGPSQSYPLKFITKEEYDRIEPNPNASSVTQKGKPWAYTFWKHSILLTDIPDKVYTLEINVGGEPIKMVESGDKTIFSPTWDETIVAGALSRLYKGIERDDQADVWQRIYRYGFAGNEKHITGGLELLKQLNDQIDKAPLIVVPSDF